MGKVSKPVLMTFDGGPLHRIQADMTWLPQVQIFVDDRDFKVLAYLRDETTYKYDAKLSKQLTACPEQFRRTMLQTFKPNQLNIKGET